MKTLKILVPLLFLGFLLSSAKVEVKILGKWVMVKMVKGDETKDAPTGEYESYMIFKEDGVIDFVKGSREPKAGEWNYDRKNKKLYITEKVDQTDEVIIKKLSKKNLILFIVEEGVTVYLERKE
jgi:hypothetical protein